MNFANPLRFLTSFVTASVFSCLVVVLTWFTTASGQGGDTDRDQDGGVSKDQFVGAGGDLGTGYRIPIPRLLRGEAADRVLRQLQLLASKVDEKSQRRPIVVLDFFADGSSLEATAEPEGTARFEEALAIARFLTSPQARRLRSVAFVGRPLRGHAHLVVLACDEFAVSPGGVMGTATLDREDADDAVLAVYQRIAAGRGVFPQTVVDAMVRPELGLYRVVMVDGKERFVGGRELKDLRREGGVLSEERLAGEGQALELSATRLRQFRWASGRVEDLRQLATRYSVQEWSELSRPESVAGGERLLRWSGAVSGRKASRVIANLGSSLRETGLETVVFELDSQGGDLGSSLRVAMMLANPADRLNRVVGYVPHQALGDSALMALAASPLYLHPDAVLGGSGSQFIDRRALDDLREAIDEFARISGRSPGLLRGIVDPEVDVYRCVDRRTGLVSFLTAEELAGERGADWERGERVEFTGGMTAKRAVELGLAEGISPTLAEAVNQAGLDRVPKPLEERRLVRAIEWLSGLSWLPRILMFVAFMTFVMELNAPGLGIPGFISLISFLLFFWLSFLAGTAEWLEVLLFTGGLACLLIEVFIIPGFGVFGFGGLVMVITSIVLASQTFVIPQNDYQFHQTLRGLVTVLVGFLGIVLGLVSLRYLLPGTPFFKHLLMPGPESVEMHEQIEREHLVHYENLVGTEGVAITPLLPGGKVRFGEQILAVVSEGAAIDSGSPVKVVLVQGNRVVVEPIEAVL